MLTDTASSKVTAAHLARTALLYVRQSSLKQVLHNTESAIRQYDLRGRAIALGWAASQITVIDIDQGHSGASAADREGFQQLVAEVSLGRAGIVLGLECSRLARNSASDRRDLWFRRCVAAGGRIMATIGSVALGGQNGACRDSWGTPGRPFGAGHRVPGPYLPERVRSRLAVQRAGGRVHDPAPGQADPVAGADGAHRHAVPQGGGVLCHLERDPVGAVRQGRPQDRRDAAVPAGAGGHRAVRGGRGRRLAGVPAGLVRLPARHPDRRPAVHLLQGRPQGDLLLLLPVGRGLRRRVHQGLRLLPLPGQDLGQRA